MSLFPDKEETLRDLRDYNAPSPMPRVDGEVQRYHFGTGGDEWVKAEDYAAMAEHAAMVEMERDALRAEVEAHKRSRQIDANEARSREMELRQEVERLREALRVIEYATERGGLHANRALFNVAVEALESRATGPTDAVLTKFVDAGPRKPRVSHDDAELE